MRRNRDVGVPDPGSDIEVMPPRGQTSYSTTSVADGTPSDGARTSVCRPDMTGTSATADTSPSDVRGAGVQPTV